MLKKLFLLALLLNFNCALPTAQTATAVSPEAAVGANKNALLRQQSFEKVWTTVNEKHFDATFGGVDWKKMREIYEPKALAAQTDAEFYGVLQKMLDELGQSHFNVVPPQAALDTEKTGATKDAGIGIELTMIDGKPVVRRVRAGSPAAKSDLKTGFVVEKIGGKTVAEILVPVDKALAVRRETEGQKQFTRARVLERNLEGKPGTTVALEVSDEKNQPRQFSVLRETAKTEYSPAMGNFPPQAIEFETRRLEKGVGYIRFNIWVLPQLAKIREALKTMADAPGVIFDLRGNPGGIGGLAPGIGGNLFTEQTSLGTMTFRASEQKFIAYPQSDVFRGKVAVLTDGGSASTSEVFAAGLQETGRARIVGETTMGAILVSLFDRLPTGAIFQYAISDYKSPKKILIEGRGVKPDVEVKLTRESLLAGRDLQLEAAVREALK
jgi:carboxyl-terminal processing protease